MTAKYREPIHFISKNNFKINEVKTILKQLKVIIESHSLEISEIQTEDVDNLVKDKAIKAFSMIRRPVLIEHTGLKIDYLNGFPDGLTQIFWDNLLADKMCELFGSDGRNKVSASTTLGYCDGKKIHIFYGTINGKISESPRGPQNFQWDCVFIPDGYEETFAEMGEKKNDISMRKIALEKLKEHLG